MNGIFGFLFVSLVWLAAPATAQDQNEDENGAEDARAPVETTSQAVTGALDIDDDLAPAILPYMQCLSDSAGVPVYSDGERVKARFEVGTDCGAQRELSRKNSFKILGRLGVKQDRIEPRVTAQFRAIDDFNNDKARTQDSASLSAETVRRYQPYVDCLVAGLRSGSPIPNGACAKEREQAVKQATAAMGSEIPEAEIQAYNDSALGQIDEFFNVPS